MTVKPSVPIVTSEIVSLSQRASVMTDFKASSRIRLNSSSISENGTNFWTSAHSRIKLSIFARRFPRDDAPNGRRKRSESPLVGRWGKAPYSKMLRHLFLEMFGLSLTVPFSVQMRLCML